MANKKEEILSILSSPAWLSIKKFCEEEKKNKEQAALALLKSDDAAINPGKTIADAKEHIGQVKAFDKILNFPEEIKKHLGEEK